MPPVRVLAGGFAFGAGSKTRFGPGENFTSERGLEIRGSARGSSQSASLRPASARFHRAATPQRENTGSESRAASSLSRGSAVTRSNSG